ncbi:DUF4350 domain-containing protein [Mucilaginibacter myungsuensis]|uniref:DUF4350 domain-containing protein n=1 Tax=Mucilaginibacter myungsuensis TaxID=649104 RepID=A0A929KSG4_9SPHI|nr:DUF4350 domain-containing protein [Mucilaginibacter myungsuensis]MBE9660686.1 DUF4350 domain-containing protein [Mucilaginibacter myungsuensis]MDN3600731.1 DUF4350 domain-containing protein [Mucilaginibacter myungsuensis]
MRGLRVYLILGSLLLILYMVAQYNQPKPTDWRPAYGSEDKVPFGSYILYNRLNDIFPKAKVSSVRAPLYEVIAEDGLKNANILIVCDFLIVDEYDHEEMIGYIKKGNNVFLATDGICDLLGDTLNINIGSELNENGQTYVNFTSKHLGDSTYRVDHNSSSNYFSKFDTLKTVVLGRNGYGHATLLKMPMGKGALYLSANPQMFTNYSLLQPEGASYAATALSFMDNGKNIVWNDYYAKGQDGDESTMRVFLSHPPLRWAFYIVVASLLLFTIYQSKRRQRIIPIIPPVTNTSVDFATTVGQVYYEQRNNTNIAQKKLTYFLEHIRQRYNLRTNLLNKELAQALIDKTGADTDLIHAILGQAALIQSGIAVKDDELLTFNHNIEQFYIQAR